MKAKRPFYKNGMIIGAVLFVLALGMTQKHPDAAAFWGVAGIVIFFVSLVRRITRRLKDRNKKPDVLNAPGTENTVQTPIQQPQNVDINVIIGDGRQSWKKTIPCLTPRKTNVNAIGKPSWTTFPTSTNLMSMLSEPVDKKSARIRVASQIRAIQSDEQVFLSRLRYHYSRHLTERQGVYGKKEGSRACSGIHHRDLCPIFFQRPE